MFIQSLSRFNNGPAAVARTSAKQDQSFINTKPSNSRSASFMRLLQHLINNLTSPEAMATTVVTQAVLQLLVLKLLASPHWGEGDA
jgi:hypothetical protein